MPSPPSHRDTAVRRALVTGGGGGIGRAAAIALAARGLEVVVCDVRGAEAVAQEIEAAGGRASAVEADLAVDIQIEDLLETLSGRSVDVLIHSAGLFPKLSFAASTTSDFDRVMAVNFRAAFILARAIWRGIAARGGGTMIFLTSGSGLLSAVDDPMQADFSLYGASKAALDRWALGIAGELAANRIFVNTLTPGAFVHTPGLRALDLAEARTGAEISPEAVAQAIAWLAEPARPELTGRRLSAMDFRRSWGD
jgi:NAD(P)-dependent dehydrogenase (short-subunit alcohol dehydrogenase family)